jgi:hypothetical protein
MIKKIIWAIIIILIGLWIWLANLGVISRGIILSRDWPLILVIIGIMTFIEALVWKQRWWK